MWEGLFHKLKQKLTALGANGLVGDYDCILSLSTSDAVVIVVQLLYRSAAIEMHYLGITLENYRSDYGFGMANKAVSESDS